MGFVRCMGYGEADLEPTKTVTSNGIVLPSSGYIGMKQVEVNVSQNLETLVANANGTYTPSQGYVGFDSVEVDVASTGTSVDKLTLSLNSSSAVSTVINFTDSATMLIESYLELTNGSYSGSGTVALQVSERESGGSSSSLFNQTFSLNNHIGFSQGQGNQGYIPLISIPSDSEIEIQGRFTEIPYGMYGQLVFLIYH